MVYILILVISCISVGLLRYRTIEHSLYNINSCMYDGIFVWAADKMLVVGILPIIIILAKNIKRAYEYNYNIVVRCGCRDKIWLRQQMKIIIVSLISYIVIMAVEAVLAYILNGGNIFVDINNNLSEDTYIGKTIIERNLTNYNINIILMLLKSVIINSLYTALIVSCENFIECITGKVTFSTIISLAFCIVYGVNPQAGYSYRIKSFGIKVYPGDFYYELLVEDLFIKKCVSLVVIILIIGAMGIFMFRRKDFTDKK